ncbi:HD-GYP domain-containing protein [Stutzerimonas zhaodongensis]|uniref:HD-GYP domain-containing protein n=1 Tax=Stutzerimonas zhaodongensis TaxID=1176257 RepID=A0A3M2HXW4_9GAMM|nr:HD-GYP domain-containing protein [Stutzerimonas zhaodongensis]MCQ4314755.1 HD-GYP domain-containing protein [Stutzerimonas zhaodongensis]RMH92259.1 HD-GYP domain-containing protein [Stutzerimonas zhaodongensis]
MKLFKSKRKRPNVVEVATKRRLHVSHLELGMYICELDRPWRQTDFLFQGFPLLKLEHIQAVRERCDYVFVDDTRRVLVDQGQMILPSATPLRVTRKMTRIPLSLEVQEAREAYRSSTLVLDQVLLDVQQGRAIDTKACQALVKRNLESMLRNESAMLWLTRLKSQDLYTSLHCLSVSILAMGFGTHLGLSDDKIETLGIAGLLHDVGKMKIDPAVLNKPGKLTEEEFRHIKLHPTFGYEALRGQDDIPAAAVQAAHGHHERLDGKGYPLGLDDYQIPFTTRVITIVDAFDAITSHRSYDNARPIQAAYDVLRSSAGQQFDDALVQEFIRWLGVFPVGTLVELHTGEVGLVLEKHPQLHLRPKVVVLRDANKNPCEARYLDLSQLTVDADGTPYRISSGIPDGAHGLFIADPQLQTIMHPELLAVLELEPEYTES